MTWIATSPTKKSPLRARPARPRVVKLLWLEFPRPESAIQFRANHVLHDRADIPDAKRSLLPFLGLLEDVLHGYAASCSMRPSEPLNGF